MDGKKPSSKDSDETDWMDGLNKKASLID